MLYLSPARGQQPVSKGCITASFFYRCQKIRIFGPKKKYCHLILINNILYLHIEKNRTSK
jgi:hypothetical protein